MRKAGRIAREVCEFAGALIKPGVTLDSIDKAVRGETFRLPIDSRILYELGILPKSVRNRKFSKIHLFECE